MRPDNTLVRRGVLWVVCAVSFFGPLLVVNPANAQLRSADSGKTNGSGQHSLSELAPGLLILGGTISGNGPASGRTLDSSHATAFIQAWLPDSVFGAPPSQNPPSTLPVYDVEVQDKYQGTLGSMTAYYASDGTSAWISMPPQSLWPGVVVTQQHWILAPDRTVAAFEGHLTAIPVPHSSPATASPSQGSFSTGWILLVAGLVVLVVAIGIVMIRRRGGGSTSTLAA